MAGKGNGKATNFIARLNASAKDLLITGPYFDLGLRTWEFVRGERVPQNCPKSLTASGGCIDIIKASE